MKRRPSTDLLTVRPSKRSASKLSATPDVSPLVDILEQYELLEAVVSNLSAKDLLALTLSSKLLHKILASRPESLRNLLGKLKCSGKGVDLRIKHHRNSPFFFAYDCTEYVQCGSKDLRRVVETRPCVNCSVATCDECRIHCVYQSIYEASSDPEDPSELPNFSGFVLLEPAEQPILSPHHLQCHEATKVPHWQNPATGEAGPYHDQGHLDVALEEDTTAPPECVKELLDLDLGLHSLSTLSASSAYDSPSPVVRSFCRVTEARKNLVCRKCFDGDLVQGPKSLPIVSESVPSLDPAGKSDPNRKCHCTLRKRFLDRWLCVGCYQKEEVLISECTKSSPTGLCDCGGDIDRVMCLWCRGEVQDTTNLTTETLRVTP